jgi:hypothetical protein
MRRGVMITAVTAALMICAVPGASASSGWTIQPTPSPTDGVDGQLLAVSCPSAASCTAVGGYGVHPEIGEGATLAEHWDGGSSWTIQETPSPPGTYWSELTGVSCASATSCTAVGDYQLTDHGESLPFAEHWDGSTWNVQTMPSPPGALDIRLRAVSCPSATSCTAVGDYDSSAYPAPTFAEYWDGSTWTIQTMPSAEPADHFALLNGVSCTAPGKCTAAGWYIQAGHGGKQLIEQHYGSRWRKISPVSGSSMPGQPQAVSCTARNNCTVVGLGASGAMAERWNGSGWTVQATPRPAQVSLNAISCTSATACTTVGYDANAPGWGTVAERYYNGAWHRQATASPAAEKEFLGVSCTSASSCTAVGSYTRAYTPLAEHS